MSNTSCHHSYLLIPGQPPTKNKSKLFYTTISTALGRRKFVGSYVVLNELAQINKHVLVNEACVAKVSFIHATRRKCEDAKDFSLYMEKRKGKKKRQEDEE